MILTFITDMMGAVTSIPVLAAPVFISLWPESKKKELWLVYKFYTFITIIWWEQLQVVIPVLAASVFISRWQESVK